VLRADLARRQGDRHSDRDARTALQNVHKFLEHHVAHQPDAAPEARIIVFDEAQRAWDQAQATRDPQRRVSRLTRANPRTPWTSCHATQAGP
jgi:Rad3-related DNA helicase